MERPVHGGPSPIPRRPIPSRIPIAGSNLPPPTRWAADCRQFLPIHKQLSESQKAIDEELMAAQGHPVDLGGYYRFDTEKVRGPDPRCGPSPSFTPSGSEN